MLRADAVRVATISFAWPGSEAIALRDPVTDRLVGETPEWQGRPLAPAAYVAGARPLLRVVLKGPPGASVSGDLSAEGTGVPAVAGGPRRIRFGADGLSRPLDVRCAGALPRTIGHRRVAWRWRLAMAGRSLRLGTTRHELFTTWRAPLDPSSWLPRNAPPSRRPWCYLPVLRWTCQWSRGRRTPKAICDALIANMSRSGLKYYVPGGHEVRNMLLLEGGMCGGFYKMFQAMAGSQGVFVHRRSYHVDWRALEDDEARWCAIVVTGPGLGHRAPPVPPADYHDVERSPMRTARIHRRRQVRRYRFWGAPGLVGDGHCVNILEYGGRLRLYDSSFGHVAELRGMRLPAVNLRRAQPLSALGNLRRAYFDHAIGYMLGSVRRPDGFYRTIIPGVGEPVTAPRDRLGLTVRTASVNSADDGLTFYWGP